MKKYRKKPVIIEAIEFSGTNHLDCSNFIGSNLHAVRPTSIVIPTLEGEMLASIGDYIIKGIKGEFYPCKPDIFINSYEEVV